MAVDGALLEVLAVGAAGLALSVGIEHFLLSRPSLLRCTGAWGAHMGLWWAAYALLVVLTGRPWCAMAATSAILVTLVLVNNAKQKNLREPFLFQDYDYFLDTLRFPRLFLPFLGLKSFCLAAVFFVSAVAGFWAEVPPASRFKLQGQLGGALLLLACAAALLWRTKRNPLAATFDPEQDLRNVGLLSSLWAYAMASRALPKACSPFGRVAAAVPGGMPHLVAVQSESFFDARSLFAGIRPDVLHVFDSLRAEAAVHGPLTVPAWGANTVRTEFSFLTGIAAARLGVHRFNPYQAVARGWAVWSLPLFLKKLGYRAICIHPYWARFYGRDRVLRQLGFDDFMDIRAFAGSRREGSYVGDMAVGERLLQALRQATCPTFVFAITMENHGPLHLEPPRPEMAEELYASLPPQGCDELGAYLRHLRNADHMLGMLRGALQNSGTPASLCFYGDHVPIMPSAYKVLKAPAGLVPYFCWSNQGARAAAPHEGKAAAFATGLSGRERPLAVHDLALTWLESMAMIAEADNPLNARPSQAPQ